LKNPGEMQDKIRETDKHNVMYGGETEETAGWKSECTTARNENELERICEMFNRMCVP
jgi:hypothetical protein